MNTVSPNSTNPIFLAFGVQYYQLFNGTMYPPLEIPAIATKASRCRSSLLLCSDT
jgi:hypothetical protein